MNAVAAQQEIGALYETHAAWLRDWLRRHTRCPHRAADLTQATFCRLLERSPYIAPDAPRSYLATVARRLLIDDTRRRDVEKVVFDTCAAHQLGVEDISPERIVAATQLLHAVLCLLDRLPEETRSAFLLRRIEGLEQKEIAIALGISVSTVKRHIALAYARCYAIAYAD